MNRKPFRFLYSILAFLSLTAGGLTESVLACNTPPTDPPPATVRRKSRTKVKIRIKNYTTFGVAAGQGCACGLKIAGLGAIVSVDSVRIVRAGTNTLVPGFSFNPNPVTTASFNDLDPGRWQAFFTVTDVTVPPNMPTDIIFDATVGPGSADDAVVAEVAGGETGTGPANPDGTVDSTDPAHVALVPPGDPSKEALAIGPNRIDSNITLWLHDLTNGPLNQGGPSVPAPGNPSSIVFVRNPDEASATDWIFTTKLVNNTFAPSKVNRDTGELAVVGSFPSGGLDPTASLYIESTSSLYIANDSSSNISIQHIDTMTGVPTPIGSVSTGPFPQYLGTITVAGQSFAVTVNCGGPNCDGPGSVSEFRADATTGLLTEVNGSPFMTGGRGAVSGAVDPSNQWMATANLASNDVSVVAINQTDGTLAPPGPLTPTGGTSTSSVVFDPSGMWVIVTDFNAPNGKVFAFDSTTGSLTPSGSFTTGAGTFATIFTPDGRFFYNPNALSANVSGYSFDPATGIAVPIPGQPFPAGGGITQVLIVNPNPTPP